MIIRHALFILALVAVCAQAQNPTQAELLFWESVRDSKNPAELQAYLQTFPNGMYAPIARVRLAALEKTAPTPSAPRPAARAPAAPPAPATVANAAPSSVTAETRMPQAGDTWTYRLTFPKRFGIPTTQERDRTQVFRVGNVVGGKIVDQLMTDGGTPSESAHSRDVYLIPQGVSVLSPYLVAFRDLSAGSLGEIEIIDAACSGEYRCAAKGRIMAREKISLAAGEFLATKVTVEQSWQAVSGASAGLQTGRMNGGRRLTIWYAPEIKRAIKVSSRHLVGDAPPIQTEFDLELVSYQVK